MKLHPFMTTAALAATTVIAGIGAASAQSVVLAPVTFSGGLYSYNYDVTTGAQRVPVVNFDFTDSNVNVVSPMKYTDYGDGSFAFTGPFKANTSYAFDFTSPDGPTSSVGVSFKGFGANPAGPAPAPESSTMVSMGILGACLGLGIIAKRRKSVAL